MSAPLADKWRLLGLIGLDAEIGPAAQCVARAILTFDGTSGHCFASAASLATVAGVSERAVVNAVKDLEKQAWMRVERGSGRTHSNRLFPAYERLESLQNVQPFDLLKSAKNDNESPQILQRNALSFRESKNGGALSRANPSGARAGARRQYGQKKGKASLAAFALQAGGFEVPEGGL